MGVVACDHLFFPRLTDDGFCCSTDIDVLDTEHLNGQHRGGHNKYVLYLEDPVLHASDSIIFKLFLFFFRAANPLNQSSASTVYEYGVHSALRLILDPNVYDNALSTVAFDGFKVTTEIHFLYNFVSNSHMQRYCSGFIA